MTTLPDHTKIAKNETKKDEKKEEKKDCCLQLEEAKKETENWKDKYMRALADYHNLERRTGEEYTRIRSQVESRLLTGFLDIMDDLEQAEVFIKDAGLKLVTNKLKSFLQKEGVQEIALLGTTYDPHTAECIEIVEGDKDNTIVEVVRKGYTLHDAVIRVARVKVSKKKK